MSTERDRGARAHASPERRRPVVRKDADGARSIGPTWESVTERIIREAQEAGAFDGLPGHGRRLVVDENPYAGEMALAFHLLRNAGAAPPWIETDKQARRLRDQVQRLLHRAWLAPVPIHATLRRELERLVADHDATVRRLESEAPSVRVRRSPIGRPAAIAALEAAIRGEPVSTDVASVSAPPAPDGVE